MNSYRVSTKQHPEINHAVRQTLESGVHRYIYYRCTKKSATIRCKQSYVREEVLVTDLSELLAQYVLPAAWAKDFECSMKDDEQNAERISRTAMQDVRSQIADLDRQLERLTDVYIAQDIERDTYLERRRTLISEKKTKEEQIALLGRNVCAWLEPLREWIKEASILDKAAQSNDLPSKKAALQKIFGSNLHLHNKKISGLANPVYFELSSMKEVAGNDIHSSSALAYLDSFRKILLKLPELGRLYSN